MIDTVRLTGFYEINYEILQGIKWSNHYMITNSKYIENPIQGEIYELHVKGNPLKIKYNDARKLLTVDVSIPKYLYKHNIKMIDDTGISKFYEKLNTLLYDGFLARPCSYNTDWKVQRMDVCWNFQVGGDVSGYVDAFSDIHIARYKTLKYGDKETVVWQNNSKRMQFYDKEKGTCP